METQTLTQETPVVSAVAESSKITAHKHVFNADFALIALAVTSIYTYLIVFTLQFLF
jgi:hypothetical protein